MASAACAESQAEQVRDARMEQANARADATEKNVEQSAEAREKSLKLEYDARQEAIAREKQPAAGATQDLNDIAKVRALYRTQAATRVDKLGVRIHEAAQKIDVLGSKAPTTLRTELSTATTEHDTLKQDIDKLDNSRTTDWESLKSQIDQRLSSLDARVSDLNDSIEKV
jgi:hypothetical protein